jgi:hypothetical protein
MDDSQQLLEWRTRIVSDLETDLQSLIKLQNKIRDAKQRLQHIDGLLSLDDRQTNPPSTESIETEDLLAACKKIQSEATEPLHATELRAKLLEKGIPLPGQGTEANLISRLHRAKDQFERMGPGTYVPVSRGIMEFQDRTLMENDSKYLTDRELVELWHDNYPDKLYLNKQNTEGVFTYVRDIRRNFNQGTQGHGKRNDQGEIVGPPETLSLPYDESGRTYRYSYRWVEACERIRSKSKKGDKHDNK